MRIANDTQLAEALGTNGAHSCNQGLYLVVKGNAQRWVFRAVRSDPLRSDKKKLLTIPLGQFGTQAPGLTLEMARAAAAQAQRDAPNGPATFRQDAAAFYDHVQAGWKSDIYRRDWMASLTNHVFPAIGEKNTAELTTSDIKAVIEPIWTKMRNADVILDRIRQVIDYAIDCDGHERFKGNPASRLRKQLPPGVKPVEGQQGSLSWQQAPALYRQLTAIDSPAACGLRLLLLCCAPRANEIVEAQWSEIKGVSGDEFHVPAERMKSRKARIIPLSRPALELLAHMRGPTNPTGYLFPTRRAGKLVGFEGKGRKRTGGYFIAFEGHMQKDAMLILFQQLLGKMVDGKLVKATDPANGKPFDLHGLRTTFATWVADNRATVYDMDAQKIALDLAPGDHMTRIYDRADLLDQRRDLAERWARFLTQTVSNQ